MRDGLTETTKAADAAKESATIAARTLVMANRPKLVVRPIEIDGFSGRRILERLRNGRTWVTNTGVLPVTLQKFWAEWLFEETLPLANPAHGAVEGHLAPMEIPAGQFVKMELPDYDVPTDVFITVNNVAEAAENGQVLGGGVPAQRSGTLYVVGCVKYRDEIGLRRMYFAYRYDPFHGRFDAVDHPNYSYEE